MYGKSPNHLEDPFSNLFYYISYKLTSVFKINPNYITLFRLIIMLIVYYLLYHNKYKTIAGLLFIFCYFLDHLDGEMARQHNMITDFGDYFDHILDNTYIIPVIIYLYVKFRNTKKFIIYLSIFIFLSLSSLVLIACQELHFTKNSDKFKNKISKALSCLHKFCIVKNTYILRFIGFGLWHVYLFYLIVIS